MSRIRQNCFSAGFHQPFRCGGCPTYSDGLHAFQQFPVDFLWSVYLIKLGFTLVCSETKSSRLNFYVRIQRIPDCGGLQTCVYQACGLLPDGILYRNTEKSHWVKYVLECMQRSAGIHPVTWLSVSTDGCLC